MSDAAPVEGKVWAGTAGAGAGLTVSAFLVWLLGGLVWGAPLDAAHATEAAAAVPVPVIGMIMLGITVGSAFAAGYRARHTARLINNASAAEIKTSVASPMRIVVDGKLVGTTGAPYMGGSSATDDAPDPHPVTNAPGASA